MNGFIFDPLTGEPTILATNRARRTDQTGAVSTISKDKKKEKKEHVDFFGKGNENMTPPTLYQDSDDWNVRVFKNKFPLIEDHEIVVHSPSEELDIEDLPHEQNVRIIRAYLNRVNHYNNQDKEVIIFNNRGGKAGASVKHPHSQIVAARGFPGTLEKEKAEAMRYYNEHSKSYWMDEIEKEIVYERRIVHQSAHFLLYVPYACRWSYEMRLVPKKHKPNFAYIDEQEINDLACVLKGALFAYNKLFDRPDRNFWLHTLRYEPFHWHIGFLPHIKVFGALEMGCGIWVSDKAVSEDAAKQLRLAFEDCDLKI
jgi:UDPglucose--hexose-1-phosphate uridylyltransferase